MFNIQEFKLGLINDVARLVDARTKYAKAVSELDELGEQFSGRSYLERLPEAFRNLLRIRYRTIEMKLTDLYCQGYPVEITTASRYVEFDCAYISNNSYLTQNLRKELLKLEEEKSPFEQVQRLESLIHRMPWEEIKEHFDLQVQNVKNAGMKAAVKKVNHYFGLNRAYHNLPSVTKRGVVVSKHYEGNGYGLHGYANTFREVVDALIPIAAESNVALGDSLNELADALWNNATTSKAIPMRTRFGKGSVVDITVFTSKINFVFGFALFEAIQAATLIYGTQEDADAIMKIADHIEAA